MNNYLKNNINPKSPYIIPNLFDDEPNQKKQKSSYVIPNLFDSTDNLQLISASDSSDIQPITAPLDKNIQNKLPEPARRETFLKASGPTILDKYDENINKLRGKLSELFEYSENPKYDKGLVDKAIFETNNQLIDIESKKNNFTQNLEDLNSKIGLAAYSNSIIKSAKSISNQLGKRYVDEDPMFIQNAAESFKRGSDQVYLSALGLSSFLGITDEKQVMETKNLYEEFISENPIKSDWFGSKFAHQAIEMLPHMINGLTVNSIIPGGAFSYWSGQFIGDTYIELRQDGVPETTARIASLAGAPLYSGIELLQLERLTPAFKNISNNIVKNSFMGALKEYGLKKYLKDGSIEIFQEGLQRGIEEYTKYFAKAAHNIDKRTFGEAAIGVIKSMGEEMINAAGPMMVLGAPAAAVNVKISMDRNAWFKDASKILPEYDDYLQNLIKNISKVTEEINKIKQNENPEAYAYLSDLRNNAVEAVNNLLKRRDEIINNLTFEETKELYENSNTRLSPEFEKINLLSTKQVLYNKLNIEMFEAENKAKKEPATETAPETKKDKSAEETANELNKIDSIIETNEFEDDFENEPESNKNIPEQENIGFTQENIKDINQINEGDAIIANNSKIIINKINDDDTFEITHILENQEPDEFGEDETMDMTVTGDLIKALLNQPNTTVIKNSLNNQPPASATAASNLETGQTIPQTNTGVNQAANVEIDNLKNQFMSLGINAGNDFANTELKNAGYSDEQIKTTIRQWNDEKDNMSVDERNKLKKTAYTDTATGLKNKNYWIANKYSEKDFSAENKNIAVLDIDDFRRFNNKYGHEVGDAVFEILGKVINKISEKYKGKLEGVRFGGEEIAIIGNGLTQTELKNIVDEMRNEVSAKSVQQHLQENDIVLENASDELNNENLFFSAGVGKNFNEADARLYGAKDKGKKQTISEIDAPDIQKLNEGKFTKAISKLEDLLYDFHLLSNNSLQLNENSNEYKDVDFKLKDKLVEIRDKILELNELAKKYNLDLDNTLKVLYNINKKELFDNVKNNINNSNTISKEALGRVRKSAIGTQRPLGNTTASGTAETVSVESGKTETTRDSITEPQQTQSNQETQTTPDEQIPSNADDNLQLSYSDSSIPKTVGVNAKLLETKLNQLTNNWKNKPKIIVHQTTKALPQNYQLAAKDNLSNIEGIFDPKRNEIHLIADNINSFKRAQEVLYHETLGHYGLREYLGDRFDTVIALVFKSLGADGLRDVADLYNLDLKTFQGRKTAADEYLARLAEKPSINPNLWQRVIAKIRELLREIFPSLKFTDADIQYLLAKSRETIINKNQNLNKTIKTNIQSNDIKYSFVGERSLDNLPVEEKKIAADNLQVAKQMKSENLNSEKIRLATGWYLDKDGKWKYEIDDKNFEIINSNNISSIGKSTIDWIADFLNINKENLIKKTATFEDIYNRQPDWEKLKEFGYADKELKVGKLSNIIKNPQIFKLYPELKDYNVSLILSYNSSFDTKNNQFRIGVKSDLEEIKKTFLHEIQHVIQEIEDFGRGGTYREFKDIDLGKEKWLKMAEEIVIFFENMPEELQELTRIINGELILKNDFLKLDTKNYDKKKLYSAIKKINENEKYKKMFKEISKLYKKQRSIDLDLIIRPLQQYERLLGEMEARETAYRADLTAEQRKALLPYQLVKEREGIDVNDAIVLFANGRVQQAIDLLENQNNQLSEIFDGDIVFSLAKDRTQTTDQMPESLNEALTLTNLPYLMKQEGYNEAKKQGNAEKANEIVVILLEKHPEKLREIQSKLEPNKSVYFVPVINAEQNKRMNSLPTQFAKILAKKLNGNYVDNIFKTGTPNTGVHTIERTTKNIDYEGNIPDKNGQYVIVDDNFTSGSTVLSLYEHIKAQGGDVKLITSLGFSKRGKTIKIQEKTLTELLKYVILESKGAIQNEKQLSEYIGYDIRKHTNAEINAIIGNRAAVIQRLNALRDAGVSGRGLSERGRVYESSGSKSEIRQNLPESGNLTNQNSTSENENNLLYSLKSDKTATSKQNQDEKAYRSYVDKNHPSIAFPELVELASYYGIEVEYVDKIGRDKEGKRLGQFRIKTNKYGEEIPRIKIVKSLFENPPEGYTPETVLAHEIGHLIDYLPKQTINEKNLISRLKVLYEFKQEAYNYIKEKDIRKELTRLSYIWEPFDLENQKIKNVRFAGRELFADFISAYLNNPALCDFHSPIFTGHFEKWINKKKNVKEIIDELRKRRTKKSGTADWIDSAVIRTVNATAQYELEKKKTREWLEKIHKKSLSEEFIDSFKPIREVLRKIGYIKPGRLEDDLNILPRLANFYHNSGSAKSYLIDFKDSIKDIKELFKTSKNRALFTTYLIARRIAEQKRNFLDPWGITPELAKDIIDNFSKNYGQKLSDNFKTASDKLKNIFDELLQDSIESGIISEKEAGLYLDRNPFYVPISIVDKLLDKDDFYLKRESTVFYERTGSEKTARMEIQTIAERIVKQSKLNEINKFKNTMIDFCKISLIDMLRNYQGKNKLSKEEIENLLNNDFKNNDIIKTISELLIKNEKEIEREILILPVEFEIIGESYPKTIKTKEGEKTVQTQIKEPKEKNGYKIFKLWENGELKMYYIRDDIHRLIDNSLNKFELNIITKWALSFQNIFKKIVVDYNIFFGANNIVRDLTNTLKYANLTKEQYIRLPKAYVTGLKESYKYLFGDGSDMMKEMFKNKVLSSHTILNEISDISEDERVLLKFDIKEKYEMPPIPNDINTVDQIFSFIKSKIKNPFKIIEILNTMTEYASKAAGWQLFDHIQDKELRGYYARTYFGSPDYMLGGSQRTVINSLFLFGNIKLQDYRRAISAIKKDYYKSPATAFLKYSLMFGSGIIWNYLIKLLNDDDENKNIAEYEWKNYYVMPLFVNDDNKTVFIRIPIDGASMPLHQLMTSIIEFADHQSGGKFIKDIATDLFDNSPIGGNINEFAKDVFQVLANRDLHFRRPIYNEYDNVTDQALDTMKWLGGKLLSPFPFRYDNMEGLTARIPFTKITNYGRKEKLYNKYEDVINNQYQRTEERKTLESDYLSNRIDETEFIEKLKGLNYTDKTIEPIKYKKNNIDIFYKYGPEINLIRKLNKKKDIEKINKILEGIENGNDKNIIKKYFKIY